MSAWLVALVGAIYLGVCVDQCIKGNLPMALVYFSYALGNMGFVWMFK